jgi:hypothetical protein
MGEKEKLRQELRDLIVRDFAMKHSLSNSEVVGLLKEIPELGLVPKPVHISLREARAIQKAEHERLRKVANEFLKVVKERVDMHVLLCDIDGLNELIQAVKVVGHYQLVEIIHKKGFDKEFTELCDKVGRVK